MTKLPKTRAAIEQAITETIGAISLLSVEIRGMNSKMQTLQESLEIFRDIINKLDEEVVKSDD